MTCRTTIYGPTGYSQVLQGNRNMLLENGIVFCMYSKVTVNNFSQCIALVSIITWILNSASVVV
jgi:hypothetical protein